MKTVYIIYDLCLVLIVRERVMGFGFGKKQGKERELGFGNKKGKEKWGLGGL